MGDEVKNDVQEMNKVFGNEVPNSENVEDVIDKSIDDVEDPEETNIDEEEVIKDEEETTDDESPEPVIKEQEADITQDEQSPEDDKDKIIAELRKKLDAKEDKKEPEQEVKEPPKQPTFDVQEFIGEDEDIEDLIREPGKFNEMLNKVYQKAVTDTQKTLGEGVLRSIPDIVRSSVDMIDRLRNMNTKFYTDNQDLSPFKKVVAAVFEEIASDNPDKEMEALLPMVADESRKRLELHKKATDKVTRKSPRLPTRKGRMTITEDKPNTDPLLNELQEMNKVIGG
jgi:hypothetical protein